MKKYFLLTALLAIAATFGIVDHTVNAQADNTAAQGTLVSPNIVISQFQPGTSASANDEFIELHNIGSAAVDLNGYVVAYRSASGTNDVGPMASWSVSTIVQPGQFYLIASNVYSGSAVPDLVYNTSTCACSLSASAGGLAIRQGPVNSGAIVDAVGWGAATNIFFEGTRTTAPGSGNSQARLQSGCQDTDNNSADFAIQSPFAPRNAAVLIQCSGGGPTSLTGLGSASPNNVAPGGLTLLTVSVIPATQPSSTGITVNANLTNISGSASQQFFDDGTNGDATAGDNVFSYFATVPVGLGGGVKSLPVSIADAQLRTANTSITLTVTAPPDPTEHLLLGNPSGATTDVNNPFNYLLVKTQYVMSYHRDRAIPNWVAWHLDTSWIGSANRQNDFRPDTSLPAGWYEVTDNDYSGSGFDRGHHCPSGDRTDTVTDNSATFFMTNMMPQAANNNQGPWANLEVYSRTLATQGNELYIIAGSTGQGGTGLNGFATTIAGGKVTVPATTWKIIVVLPAGSNDLDRINKNTRVIAVIMPNAQSIGINTPWQNFRVSVHQIEKLTGYSFFSNVRPIVRPLLKNRVDNQ